MDEKATIAVPSSKETVNEDIANIVGDDSKEHTDAEFSKTYAYEEGPSIINNLDYVTDKAEGRFRTKVANESSIKVKNNSISPNIMSKISKYGANDISADNFQFEASQQSIFQMAMEEKKPILQEMD